MKMKLTFSCVVCVLALAFSGSVAVGQLYTEDFDDGQAVNRWVAQAGIGYSDTSTPVNQQVPMDTNFDREPLLPAVDGINDDFSGFSFDYSVAGIPSAPNSSGGSTIGLKLYSSLFSNDLGGFSVNPIGLDLTGNYSVTFDAWSSTVGTSSGWPGGGSGSTMLSHFGIMTTGSQSETLLSSDGVFFAYTGDAGSSADYRAYSIDEPDSYDASPGEPNGIYHAGGRNGTEQLYVDAVGGDVTVPQSVKDAFPTQNMEGTLSSGAAAFQWHSHEIRKLDESVEWYMNGFKLITVDLTGFSQEDLDAMGGNLSFGHSDINYSSSTDPLAPDLLFTLIDNIEVNAITSAGNADFDGDGDIDGNDFLTWQRGFGIDDGTAQPSDGDATGDGNVDGADLVAWQDQYGSSPLSANVAAVPEPATWASLIVAAALGFVLISPRHALVPQRVP